jgi:hypothetical protein
VVLESSTEALIMLAVEAGRLLLLLLLVVDVEVKVSDDLDF